MGCTLDRDGNYEIKEVIHDASTGKYRVKLAHPPASCQSGSLDNSKTVIQANSKVAKATLAFSTKLNAPVVLLPRGMEVQEFKDPTLTPKDAGGLGLFAWIVILAGVAGIAWLVYKNFFATKPKDPPTIDFTEAVRQRAAEDALKRARAHEAERAAKAAAPKTPSEVVQTGEKGDTFIPPAAPKTVDEIWDQHGGIRTAELNVGMGHTYIPPATRQAPQAIQHTTIIQNGGGGTDFATGMMLGMMATGGRQREVIRERDVEKTTIIKEKEAAPEKKAAPKADDPPAPTFSSDEDDTVSSDSTDSYGSDSSDSFSSDDSSFGSDD